MKILFTVPVLLIIYSGCSLNNLAVNALADALSAGNGLAYARDDDPEFVADALPFGLKTMEVVLESTPQHYNLLIAATAGFVKYGYAFVLYPAEENQDADFESWQAAKSRAKKLFIRARAYGLRAISVKYTSFALRLTEDPPMAVKMVNKEDIPALYWTAAAWASALSMDKSDMALVADLPVIESMMERALQLDESWQKGTLHEFFIVFAASKAGASGNGYLESKKHFERAMELNEGKSIAPLVSLAESVAVPQQDREQFQKLLQQALEFDVDKYPAHRLENIIARQRAESLFKNIDQYFIE